MAQFVVLDTNILIRFIMRGDSADGQKHWKELTEFVKSGKIKLLNPQVVEFEFAGQCKEAIERLNREIAHIDQRCADDLKTTISRPFHDGKRERKAWNEIDDIQTWLNNESGELSSRLGGWHQAKLKAMQEREKHVNSLMKLPGVDRLPFDVDVLLRTKQRIMERRLKYIDGDPKPESDYNIIDSVVRYLARTNEQKPVLLCSENAKHLALEMKDGRHIIHQSYSNELPAGSGFFLSLSELVKFIREGKPVEEISPERINEAIERENEKPLSRQDLRNALMNLNSAVSSLKRIQRRSREIDSIDRNNIEEMILDGRYLLKMARSATVNSRDIGSRATYLIEKAGRMRDYAIDDDGVYVRMKRYIKALKALQSVVDIPEQTFEGFL
jgi:predicted nucleic acid-binding protein